MLREELHVPRREREVDSVAHLLRHVEEIGELPAAALAKAGNEAPTRLEGIKNIAQCRLAAFLCQEAHDIAGRYGNIKGPFWHLFLAQVTDEPLPLWEIVLGVLDEDGIYVDSHDAVAAAKQLAAYAAGATAGVENGGVAFHHGVDKPSLTIDVLALCGKQLPFACKIMGVLGISLGYFFPRRHRFDYITRPRCKIYPLLKIAIQILRTCPLYRAKEAETMPSVPSPFRGRKKPGPPSKPSSLPVPPERAIEHCRVFVDGEALPGEYSTSSALEAIEEYGRGFIWVGMHEPYESQMTKVASQFGIHELIVEDAVMAHQRPKLERYDDQLFVVARSVNYRDHDEVTDKRQIISTGEIQMIMGSNFIITVRHGAKLPNLAYTVEDEQDLVELGPVAMAWKILDMMVDRYSEISRLISIEVDELEEEIFTPNLKFDVDRIYMFKREVLEMKHAIDPLSVALKSMVSDHKDLISKQLRSYLRDVNDHELVVKDQVSSFDERLTSLIDASVAKVTMQQNSDMRTISAVVGMWAAPTLVAGIYGMNFDIMPELHWALGYPMAIIIMIMVVVGLWAWFRKNHWL